MPSEIVLACSKVLAQHQLSIAFAESATAGRLSSEFALVPESGKILKGGIICYDAIVKECVLHLPKILIEKYTPESAEVTEALAINLKKLIPADIHVAVTGLTSPGGSETPEKPVGTIFIHMLIKETPFAVRTTFQGSPEAIVMQTIDQVADSLMDALESQQ
jgi:nicotinamide-nucleotide amidase